MAPLSLIPLCFWHRSSVIFGASSGATSSSALERITDLSRSYLLTKFIFVAPNLATISLCVITSNRIAWDLIVSRKQIVVSSYASVKARTV